MLRLLVVEDNIAHQYIINHFCEMYGYSVRFVETGEEALTAFSDEKFAAILMDLTLLDVSGLDCARKIRQLEIADSIERTPIIALTSDPTRELECYAAGMDDFLVKPFAPDALSKTLARFVHHENSPSRRHLPETAARYFEKRRPLPV